MTVSITVCAPSQNRCIVIDNVIVDTGSVGLRLQERSLDGFVLPPERVSAQDVAECFRFVGHNNIWGKIRIADVHLGGLVASAIPVEVADTNLERPSNGACPDYHNEASSNGTLGIGRAILERSGSLFECLGNDCAPLPKGPAEDALRLPNPVSRLPKDNDGEEFVIPAARNAVSPEIHGLLVLGVNTEPNNMLSKDVAIIPLDSTGLFRTEFDGTLYNKSYIDSGTQTISFHDENLSPCVNAKNDYCTDAASNSLVASLSDSAAQGSIQNEFHLMRQPGIAGRLYDVYADIVSNSRDPIVFGDCPFSLANAFTLCSRANCHQERPVSARFMVSFPQGFETAEVTVRQAVTIEKELSC